MCKFINVFSCNNLRLLHYIPKIQDCYIKYRKYLCDDFAPDDIYALVSSYYPYFWIILDNSNNFMGFVGLDNFVGTGSINYSAELTTCFERSAWGDFTRYSAKIFLKKCFDEFGLYKIKAQIFPDNFRVKTLLKDAGFKYEATLPKETLRFGEMQNLDIYSLYKEYYYGG